MGTIIESTDWRKNEACCVEDSDVGIGVMSVVGEEVGVLVGT